MAELPSLFALWVRPIVQGPAVMVLLLAPGSEWTRSGGRPCTPACDFGRGRRLATSHWQIRRPVSFENVEMDVVIVIAVSARSQHGRKTMTGRIPRTISEWLRSCLMGEFDVTTVRQDQGARSMALPLPCSLSLAWQCCYGRDTGRTESLDAAQCIPKRSKMIGSLVADPAANDSAMAQRKTAVGLTSTRLRLGSSTASSRIISRPPQSPGPMSRGSNSIAAIAASVDRSHSMRW